MNSQNEEDQRESLNQLQLNKGIEFMLRRRVAQTESKQGFRLNKTINLLHRTFHFNLEFFWGVDKPTKE
jgi:hypothetical protein